MLPLDLVLQFDSPQVAVDVGVFHARQFCIQPLDLGAKTEQFGAVGPVVARVCAAPTAWHLNFVSHRSNLSNSISSAG
jgi:hypothetical protein